MELYTEFVRLSTPSRGRNSRYSEPLGTSPLVLHVDEAECCTVIQDFYIFVPRGQYYGMMKGACLPETLHNKGLLCVRPQHSLYVNQTFNCTYEVE